MINQGESLAARVAKIQKMNRAELQQLWEELHGKKAPDLHWNILRQRLAYRVQALALGGLSEKAVKTHQEVKADLKRKPTRNSRIRYVPAGTRLSREFNNEVHEVIVLEEGFEYRGKVYKSLSGIARHITGVHWSGPVFFGLNKKDGENSHGKG